MRTDQSERFRGQIRLLPWPGTAKAFNDLDRHGRLRAPGGRESHKWEQRIKCEHGGLRRLPLVIECTCMSPGRQLLRPG
jgi:hypothetical protein